MSLVKVRCAVATAEANVKTEISIRKGVRRRIVEANSSLMVVLMIASLGLGRKLKQPGSTGIQTLRCIANRAKLSIVALIACFLERCTLGLDEMINALPGEQKKLVHLFPGKGRAFGCPLHFDEPAIAGADDIHINFGA